MDPAAQLGAMLAVFTTYGLVNVQDAIAACRRGDATPDQQRLVVKLLEAMTAS